MNLLIGLLLALSAQLPQAPATPGAAPSAGTQAPTILKVIALVGSGEGQAAQQIPVELQPMQALLKELPFGRFRVEHQQEIPIEVGAAAVVSINPTYTLTLLPEEETEDNQYVVDLKIATPDGVSALTARGKIPVQKPVVMRGLDAEDGELIVAMILTREGGGQGQNEEKDEGEEQEDEEQQKQEQEPDPGEQEPQDPQDQKQEPQPDQGEQQDQQQQEQSDQQQDPQEQPQEAHKPENIEAILQHLEQMDRREQRELIQQKDARKILGEWW
jgi:hypothetical protein